MRRLSVYMFDHWCRFRLYLGNIQESYLVCFRAYMATEHFHIAGSRLRGNTSFGFFAGCKICPVGGLIIRGIPAFDTIVRKVVELILRPWTDMA